MGRTPSPPRKTVLSQEAEVQNRRAISSPGSLSSAQTPSNRISFGCRGGSGIRTHETRKGPTGFQDQRLRPLGHPSRSRTRLGLDVFKPLADPMWSKAPRSAGVGASGGQFCKKVWAADNAIDGVQGCLRIDLRIGRVNDNHAAGQRGLESRHLYDHDSQGRVGD